MMLAVSMIAGLLLGVAVFAVTRKHAAIAVWTALVLGLLGSVLFLATISGWFLPDLGRFGAIGIGPLSGIATALALGCVLRGERRPLTWTALAVSVPPLLFMMAFGIAELLGPPH